MRIMLHLGLKRPLPGPLLCQVSQCRFSTTTNSSRIVDLRSDTVTSPTRGMLEAALTAKTGDDVLGEDPTVLELENQVADLFGKPKGLYVPTGTMANLVALLSHCNERSTEIIIGASSHISLWEAGNAAGLGGIHTRQLPEDPLTAELDPSDIVNAFRLDDDDHYSKTRVLCLENTHNMCGGVALPKAYMDSMGELTKKLGIRLHLDGARVWNAAVFHQLALRDLCAKVDSVSVCLSKGLGAPLGSVLVGESEFIRLAKRARKRCGGGMRQAGVVAAMGLYAIRNNVERLSEDHGRAKKLASALIQGGFNLARNGQVETNMFYCKLPEKSMVSKEEFKSKLEKNYGVKLGAGYSRGGEYFRCVTHLDITDHDIDRASEAMVALVQKGY